MLRAVTEVVARFGYAETTVDRLLNAAGVSRSTFYQHFANADECFGAAYEAHADQLVAMIDSARRAEPNRPLAVLGALVDTSIARPVVARMLMREGLAVGHAGHAARDELIRRLEPAFTAQDPAALAIDLPSDVLLGGVFRFIAMRLTDARPTADLRHDVLEWASVFMRRERESSWSARFNPLPENAHRTAPPVRPTARAAKSSRDRMLLATAEVICDRGYRATTVSDIAQAAGMSRREFYTQFATKSAAFLAAYEHGFRSTLAACTPAFFAERDWPARVWRCAEAFTRFMAREPLLAHIGFVECYAPGPAFAQRVHDTQVAFTIFLGEGYRQRPEAESLPRSCADLVATAIFEAGFRGVRLGPAIYMRRLQQLAVYIALAPFLGRDEAGAFVLSRLSAPDPNAHGHER